MPPHPTLFFRRGLITKLGTYDTSYRISADYDLVLRYFSSTYINARYVQRVLVKMRIGGESNQSLRKIIRKSREDLRALRSNGIGGYMTLLWKNLSKTSQFLIKK